MRISEDSKELVQLKYVEELLEIIPRRYANIEQHKLNKPKGMTLHEAIDTEYLGIAGELAELWAELHLEAFLNEGMFPDESDLSEIKQEIEKLVNTQRPKEHTFQPFVLELYDSLPMQIYTLLKNKVRRMELEERLQKPIPATQPGSQINIQGDNYGSVQQGGEGNTQHINHPDKPTNKS